MRTELTLKWETHGNDAEHLVSQVCEHLDKRNKHLKDDALNRQVVTAILAAREGVLEVRLSSLPKKYKETVKAAVEALTGPVLTRASRTSNYELRDEYKTANALFQTHHITQGDMDRYALPVHTTYGTIYRDGTHGEVPFDKIGRIGYVKPSLVRIVAPHHHWQMFVDGEPTPSRQWQHLDEVSDEHPIHEEVMEAVVSQARRRGIVVVRYGTDGFITPAPDALVFTLDTALVRICNRSGQRPLLHVTDIYGRTHTRWGSKA